MEIARTYMYVCVLLTTLTSNRQMSLGQTYLFIPNTKQCVEIFYYLTAGMSNWRPAGRMWPHCVFNAARNDLLHLHSTEIYNKVKKFTIISCIK